MSHTITITRLPDDERDDAEYTIGGSCDQWCTVWRECDEKHPAPTDDEIASGEATWHGVEHMSILDIGWSVQTTECGLDYAYDLGLEADRVEALGAYVLDVEWDGDGWQACIGDPVEGGGGS